MEFNSAFKRLISGFNSLPLKELEMAYIHLQPATHLTVTLFILRRGFAIEAKIVIFQIYLF